jgi:hypothetical protein
LFALASAALWAEPVIRQFSGHLNSQDYPLWFTVGQRVLQNGPIYPTQHGEFDFLYPPFAALLLAIPSYFGRPVLVVAMATATLASWWLSIYLSNRLSTESQKTPAWAIALPIGATLPFVFDQFHMGQPNLILLALMLTGFFCLGIGRPWLGGAAFAIAASFKAFPVLVLPYLLWRRDWAAAIGMLIACVVFLVVLPGGIRGFERNQTELDQWVHGMLLSGDDAGFAQRADHWSFKNQSLYAVEHRLASPIDAVRNVYFPAAPPLYVNLLDLDRSAADALFLVSAIGIGLAFVALLPARNRRTPQSNAAEWSIVLLLVVVASPVAYSYYFVWLLPAFTILVRSAASAPDRKLAHGTLAMIGLSFLLLAIGINAVTPPFPQAAGNVLWATMVAALALVVQMRRSAHGTSTPPTTPQSA